MLRAFEFVGDDTFNSLGRACFISIPEDATEPAWHDSGAYLLANERSWNTVRLQLSVKPFGLRGVSGSIAEEGAILELPVRIV